MLFYHHSLIRNSNFTPFHQNWKLFHNAQNLNFLKISRRPFFQSQSLESIMNSNFFLPNHFTNLVEFLCTIISRRGGDFFEKVFKAKKRWGECWIGYDFRWSFTSGGKYYFKLFRTCWRKILSKRKFNSFQFHFKKDFWKLYVQLHLLLHFSLQNHIFQKPILVLSANEHFSRQKNWKGINTKNDIGGK